EGDRRRDGAVVEEDRQAGVAWTPPEIGTARIDALSDLVPPLAPERADPPGLMRRQDRELDPGLGQHFQRLVVGRRLRQPHAFRLAAETMTEVGEAPARLRDLVATAAERQDHVV